MSIAYVLENDVVDVLTDVIHIGHLVKSIDHAFVGIIEGSNELCMNKLIRFCVICAVFLKCTVALNSTLLLSLVFQSLHMSA